MVKYICRVYKTMFKISEYDKVWKGTSLSKHCWLIRCCGGCGHYGFIQGGNLRPGPCMPRRVITIAPTALSIYGSLIKAPYLICIQNSLVWHGQIVFKSRPQLTTWQPVKSTHDWDAGNSFLEQVSLKDITVWTIESIITLIA